MENYKQEKITLKTDKLNKYKRINTWVESSGLLTDAQIDIIIEADRRMTILENEELMVK